jgi:carbon-monoxide dehydrogenase medium subunit
MYSFHYTRAHSVGDAIGAAGRSDEAKYLAGGQTLLPTMKQRLAKPSTLIDLSRVPELKGIHVQGNGVGIGAMTTHAEVAAHDGVRAAISALAKLADGIGDAQVRHRGTMGGSLANNDPAADYPAAALALGATVVTNKRQIPADQYFTGLFSTALEPGELITAIGFPKPQKSGYAKFEQRASRYALVGVFVAQTASGVRVAVTGSGASGVFRVPEMEQALAANFSPDAVKGIKVDAANMLSDIHGSAEYRAALVTVMAERAVASAA